MSTIADVSRIYNTVNTLVNKEQKGYIKVSEFNTLLQQAELENLNKNYFQSDMGNKAQRGVESDLERTDALAPYLRKLTGTSSIVDLSDDASDFMHLVSVSSGSTEIKSVRHSELYSILGSSIVGPSTSSPIYVLSPTTVGSENSTAINFYTSATGPDSLTYNIIYLKQPTMPALGHYRVNTISGLFDASTSTAIDAPKSEHVKITKLILKYLGLNLKDADVFSYASGELATE